MERKTLCPEPLRKNVDRLMLELHTDEETSTAMILMTAVLTDLHPEDDIIADIIIRDCREYGKPEHA